MSNGKPNGYILHETTNVVIIATGIQSRSTNTKTGAMIQIYSLLRNVDPINGSRTGEDKRICFDCKFRGTSTIDVNGESIVVGRACYVTLMHGPLAVYRAYKAGSYPKLSRKRIPEIFANRAVRFGAYGETVLIPKPIVESIAAVASKWTGYTHQWRKPQHAWIKQYVMASCDSPADYARATSEGWRTFRVSADDVALPGEINCPASIESGHRTECERCGLCQGTSKGMMVRNVYIQAHGNGSKNAFKILQ